MTLGKQCRSGNLSLERRIKSDLGDTEVDVLFLSHFDKDHISGVGFLRPRYVVVPYLEEDQIALFKIFNEVTDDPTLKINIRAASDPESLFPGSHIIRVRPDTEGHGQDRPEQFDIYPSGPQQQYDHHKALPPEISSGSSIRFVDPSTTSDRANTLNSTLWDYTVFHPRFGDTVQAFKDKLKSEASYLDWEKLISPNNGTYIRDNIDRLKEIYKQLSPQNLNEHSLVVCSTPDDASIPTPPKPRCFRLYSILSSHYSAGVFATERISLHRAGCIYFGDATIKSVWLNKFYTALGAKLKLVQTAQVAHHGAATSNEECFLRIAHHHLPCPVLCIISAGSRNSYGHPSLSVIRNLQVNDGIVHQVSEDPATVLCQTSII